MPDSPTPYWADDPPSTSRTFYGLSLKEYKALPHLERMRRMAAYDKQRGMKPTYHQCPVYGTTWTTLKPTKKPRKK